MWESVELRRTWRSHFQAPEPWYWYRPRARNEARSLPQDRRATRLSGFRTSRFTKQSYKASARSRAVQRRPTEAEDSEIEVPIEDFFHADTNSRARKDLCTLHKKLGAKFVVFTKLRIDPIEGPGPGQHKLPLPSLYPFTFS